MSLIFTESWANFPTFTGAEVADTTNNALRAAYLSIFSQWGYAAGAQNTANGPVVRADPLFPARRVFSQSCATTFQTGNDGATVELPMQAGVEPFVMGFMMWVPLEYVPTALGSSTNTVFQVRMGGFELFTINCDLTARYATGAAQSTRALKVGQANYIEFRYDGNEVRVWFDDVLVLQQAVKTAPGRVVFSYRTNAISTGNPGSVVGASGRFGINHIYGLLEDNVLPNVRLGPTTRVLGVRPNADAQAQWSRPSGPASNAAVAGAEIVSNPSITLQTETVGSTDFYTGTADSAVASATLVHGISVKVQALNLDTIRHSIKALARVGVSENEGNNEDAKTLNSLGQFTTNNITAACRLASGGHIVGMPTDSLWIGADPTDLGTFAQSTSVPARTTYITSIAKNAAGRVVALCSDNQIVYYGDESGNTVPAWTAGNHGGGTQGFFIAAAPDNSFYAIAANSALLRRSADGGATWATVVSLPNHATGARSLAIRDGVFLSSGAVSTSGFAVNRSTVGTSGWATVYTTPTLGGFSVAIQYPVPIMIGATGICVMAISVAAGGVMNFFRSADYGLTWAPVTGTTGAYVQSARCGAFIDDSGPNGGYFVVGLGNSSNATSGVILISRDGNNWVPMQIAPGFLPRAIAPLGFDEGFVVYGDGGVMQAYSGQNVDVALAPLGSYTKVAQFMTLNPQTSAPWTGTEAAAAQFGMRLSE